MAHRKEILFKKKENSAQGFAALTCYVPFFYIKTEFSIVRKRKEMTLLFKVK